MLRTLLVLPLFGAAVILLLPMHNPVTARRIATLAATITLLLAVTIVGGLDPIDPAIQFFEVSEWNPRLGSSFALGLDGISAPMLLLAASLSLVAICVSGAIRARYKSYFVLLLLLESALIGVFSARDWSLFYLFWELTLVPLFFLIDRWGGTQRHRAALNFVLYTMGGSVFILIALLVVYDLAPVQSFDMTTLEQAARSLPVATQVALLAGFLIGFGVKMPIVPLHGWLPLAHVEAPGPVSILLSGVLLKMGAYGLLRAAALLPDGIAALAPWLAAIAVTSVLYGAILAWRSTNIKSMIAYSSVSHMGIVLFATATLSQTGLTAAVFQMIAHGLTAGILFLAAGIIYERVHTLDSAAIGNLTLRGPRMALLTAFALLAATGLPPTAGFVAEIHALLAGFERYGLWVAILGIAMLTSAAYAVRTVSLLVHGPATPPGTSRPLPDLNRLETGIGLLLAMTILMLGVWPSPLLELTHASVTGLADLLTGRIAHGH